mgnify:CR=1 FL=1
MNAPILSTERLILRPLTSVDAPYMFVWASDPRVTKYLPYTRYTRVQDAIEWLKTLAEEEGAYYFGVTRRTDHMLIGSSSLTWRADQQAWEIGYNLRHDCWNQGYATEATRAMIAFARDQKGVTLFGANHAVDNPASGKVMQKCGLHFERDDEYSSFDGLRKYAAKRYAGTAEDTRTAEKDV